MSDPSSRALKNVKLGKGVVIYDFVNLYDCEIGDGSVQEATGGRVR